MRLLCSFTVLTVLTVLAVLAVPHARAQRGRTAVYAELLGNGVFYSVNVERRVRPDVALRVGAAYVSNDGTGDDPLVTNDVFLPVMANYLTGRGNHHFELGGGIVVLLVTSGDGPASALPTSTVGYRYQRPGGGLVFRAGLMPTYFPEVESVLPWAGTSLGYAF